MAIEANNDNKLATTVNEGKNLDISVGGVRYLRIPIKTRVILADDDLNEVVSQYSAELVEDGDILFVTEKIVAITQGRAYPVDSIESRPLAVLLSKYVTKTSHGIGLGIPETMEMALRECGTPRILLAAAVAAVTKVFGRRGDFYRIAGSKARGIDGPTALTIPPYNSQVVLVPERPDEVAAELRAILGKQIDVAIVDINDFGGNVLGSTLDRSGQRRVAEILGDNPLGQKSQSTPLGIIRAA